jgi:hypothetical protein
MNLSVVSDNILHVDGKFLQVGPPMRMYDSKKLQRILTEGHDLIVEAIEEMYQQFLQRNAELPRKNEQLRKALKPVSGEPLRDLLIPVTVQRGSVWVMRFTENEGSVINEEGWKANLYKQEDRDVYREREHIKPAFLPYWEAAMAAGFAPEIRMASSPKEMRGWCLLVRTLKN